jgi:hypothetical protein
LPLLLRQCSFRGFVEIARVDFRNGQACQPVAIKRVGAASLEPVFDCEELVAAERGERVVDNLLPLVLFRLSTITPDTLRKSEKVSVIAVGPAMPTWL